MNKRPWQKRNFRAKKERKVSHSKTNPRFLFKEILVSAQRGLKGEKNCSFALEQILSAKLFSEWSISGHVCSKSRSRNSKTFFLCKLCFVACLVLLVRLVFQTRLVSYERRYSIFESDRVSLWAKSPRHNNNTRVYKTCTSFFHVSNN